MLAARLKNIIFSLLLVEVGSSALVFIICCYMVYRYPGRFGESRLEPLFFLVALFFVMLFTFFALFYQKIARFSRFTNSISWGGFFSAQLALLAWGLVFLGMVLVSSQREMAYLIIGFTLGSMILIAVAHTAVTALLHRAYNRPTNKLKVLLVGMNNRTMEFCHILKSTPHLGAEVRGYLDEENHPNAPAPYLGLPKDIHDVLYHEIIDVVFIFLPVRTYYDTIQHVIEESGFFGVTSHIVGNVFEVEHIKKQSLCINDFGNLAFSSTTNDFIGLTCKRILDVILSGGALIALSPLLLLIALFIKLSSRGPVFFYQERIGLNKRRFKMIKFRTMIPGAEKHTRVLAHLNEMDGPAFKITNDPRIYRGGSFLRRHSLDELPQLINVLRGDMSVVGPRPLSARDFDRLQEEWQRKRFSMRPGLTCIWQVSGRGEVSFMQWMEMDLEYIDNWSLGLDFSLIMKTFKIVFVGTGA